MAQAFSFLNDQPKAQKQAENQWGRQFGAQQDQMNRAMQQQQQQNAMSSQGQASAAQRANDWQVQNFGADFAQRQQQAFQNQQQMAQGRGMYPQGGYEQFARPAAGPNPYQQSMYAPDRYGAQNRMMPQGGQVGIASGGGQGIPMPRGGYNGQIGAPGGPPPGPGGGGPPGTGQQYPQWNLGQWNPTMPQQGQVDPGMPREGGGSWWLNQPGIGGPQGLFNPSNFADKNLPYGRMLEESLPWAQFGQNASQYQSDFNESRRRWNQEQGWNQGMDTAQFGLLTRQQMAAEETARLAAAQRGEEFGWQRQTDIWGRELAQQDLGLRGQEIANTGQYQQGLLSNQQFANQATAQYQQGLIANQQQANQIDEMFKSGQLSLGQRNAALAELTQQQTYGIQQGTLAEQIRASQASEALRAQEMQAGLRAASMQAYGRSVAPSARWNRSWS